MSVFNFGFKNPFANGADSSEIQPFPDENRGLGIAFDQTEGKPEMKGLNGLFNKITQSLLSIRQNGLLGWVNDLEYILVCLCCFAWLDKAYQTQQQSHPECIQDH